MRNEEENDEQPTEIISDHEPINELKKYDFIDELPESLRDAIRCFFINISVRNLRGDQYDHNTMLVNISQLKVHQDRLQILIEEYRKELFYLFIN